MHICVAFFYLLFEIVFRCLFLEKKTAVFNHFIRFKIYTVLKKKEQLFLIMAIFADTLNFLVAAMAK